MTIAFIPLAESHFPFLLKWLESRHVKEWWDQDVTWTPELIQEKFGNYVKGYKRSKFKDQVAEKPMHAFIIVFDDTPIGYIQYYNKHDFPSEQGSETTELPISCAGLDWYIGEYEFTGKGIGSKALSHFLELHVFPSFESVFVDPDTANLAAIRAYEKAGFKTIKLVNKGTVAWMLKEQPRRKIHESPLTNELKNHIYEAFGHHATRCMGINGLAEEPIAFEVREEDKLIGCIVVQLFWGQLHIKYLLVKEPYRGQCIGRHLMEHALNFGETQGCHFAFVETLSYQAPEFYQKLGFRIDFVRHGYDKKISFYYLSKDLGKIELSEINIRPFTQSDIPIIVANFAEHHWPKPSSTFEKYLQEQLSSKRLVWVAHIKGQFAGYITLKWQSQYQPFRTNQIPEIMDLNVLRPFRNVGVGSKLLEIAETTARTQSNVVGIGVGLYDDYGEAQKLYVKRGYIPDGRGITYNYEPIVPGSNVTLDDDLVLWFTKKI